MIIIYRTAKQAFQIRQTFNCPFFKWPTMVRAKLKLPGSYELAMSRRMLQPKKGFVSGDPGDCYRKLGFGPIAAIPGNPLQRAAVVVGMTFISIAEG